MRLIVAEDDKLSRQRLEEALRQAGHEPIVTKNGAEALRAFETGTGPALLLLDWVMPILDGVAVCRRVRLVAQAPVYVIFMSSRGRQENLAEAFEAGADDFVPKPFSLETMLTRVRVGLRMLSGSRAGRFLFEEALVEGLRSDGGVVVTRDQGTVGRVFLSAGRVAWAHVWGQPSGIAAVLGEGHALTADEIAAVLEECRGTKRHFADVLVGWGMVDPGTMRDRLRKFLSARIALMAEFQDARAMFVPEPWSAGPAISFALEEVYEPDSARIVPSDNLPQAPASGPAEVPPSIDGASVTDARTVCLVHGSSGAVLSCHGEQPEESMVRALLSAVQIAGSTRCEEIALTDDDSYHFVQRVRGRADRFVYARVARRDTTFAMARLSLGVLVAGLAEPAETTLRRRGPAAGRLGRDRPVALERGRRIASRQPLRSPRGRGRRREHRARCRAHRMVGAAHGARLPAPAAPGGAAVALPDVRTLDAAGHDERASRAQVRELWRAPRSDELAP